MEKIRGKGSGCLPSRALSTLITELDPAFPSDALGLRVPIVSDKKQLSLLPDHEAPDLGGGVMGMGDGC